MTVEYLNPTLSSVAPTKSVEATPSGVGCSSVTKSGAPCRAIAVLKSGQCIAHDPDSGEKWDAARRKGGSHNSRRWRLEKSLADNPSLGGVIAVLGETVEAVRAGVLPGAIGNSVGSLSRSLVAAIESAQSADKLRSLEQLLDDLTAEKSVPVPPRPLRAAG